MGLDQNHIQELMAQADAQSQPPAIDQIRSRWGDPRDVVNGVATRRHKGYDLHAAMGTPYGVPLPGVVTNVGYNGKRAGNWFEVEYQMPDGRPARQRFMHNTSLKVDVGQKVNPGEVLAISGDTGNAKGRPHIHTEWREKDGPKGFMPVNPATVLDMQYPIMLNGTSSSASTNTQTPASTPEPVDPDRLAKLMAQADQLATPHVTSNVREDVDFNAPIPATPQQGASPTLPNVQAGGEAPKPFESYQGQDLSLFADAGRRWSQFAQGSRPEFAGDTSPDTLGAPVTFNISAPKSRYPTQDEINDALITSLGYPGMGARMRKDLGMNLINSGQIGPMDEFAKTGKYNDTTGQYELQLRPFQEIYRGVAAYAKGGKEEFQKELARMWDERQATAQKEEQFYNSKISTPFGEYTGEELTKPSDLRLMVSRIGQANAQYLYNIQSIGVQSYMRARHGEDSPEYQQAFQDWKRSQEALSTSLASTPDYSGGVSGFLGKAGELGGAIIRMKALPIPGGMPVMAMLENVHRGRVEAVTSGMKMLAFEATGQIGGNAGANTFNMSTLGGRLARQGLARSLQASTAMALVAGHSLFTREPVNIRELRDEGLFGFMLPVGKGREAGSRITALTEPPSSRRIDEITPQESFDLRLHDTGLKPTDPDNIDIASGANIESAREQMMQNLLFLRGYMESPESSRNPAFRKLVRKQVKSLEDQIPQKEIDSYLFEARTGIKLSDEPTIAKNGAPEPTTSMPPMASSDIEGRVEPVLAREGRPALTPILKEGEIAPGVTRKDVTDLALRYAEMEYASKGGSPDARNEIDILRNNPDDLLVGTDVWDKALHDLGVDEYASSIGPSAKLAEFRPPTPGKPNGYVVMSSPALQELYSIFEGKADISGLNMPRPQAERALSTLHTYINGIGDNTDSPILKAQKAQYEGMASAIEMALKPSESENGDKAKPVEVVAFDPMDRMGSQTIQDLKTTRRHEDIHTQQNLLDPWSHVDVDALASNPIWGKISSTLLRDEAYKDSDPDLLAREAGAFIGSGEWKRLGISRDEAKAFLAHYFELIGNWWGSDSIDMFRKIHPELQEVRDNAQAYTKEIEAQGGTAYTRSQESGVSPPDSVDARQGSDVGEVRSTLPAARSKDTGDGEGDAEPPKIDPEKFVRIDKLDTSEDTKQLLRDAYTRAVSEQGDIQRMTNDDFMREARAELPPEVIRDLKPRTDSEFQSDLELIRAAQNTQVKVAEDLVTLRKAYDQSRQSTSINPATDAPYTSEERDFLERQVAQKESDLNGLIKFLYPTRSQAGQRLALYARMAKNSFSFDYWLGQLDSIIRKGGGDPSSPRYGEARDTVVNYLKEGQRVKDQVDQISDELNAKEAGQDASNSQKKREVAQKRETKEKELSDTEAASKLAKQVEARLKQLTARRDLLLKQASGELPPMAKHTPSITSDKIQEVEAEIHDLNNTVSLLRKNYTQGGDRAGIPGSRIENLEERRVQELKKKLDVANKQLNDELSLDMRVRTVKPSSPEIQQLETQLSIAQEALKTKRKTENEKYPLVGRNFNTDTRITDVINSEAAKLRRQLTQLKQQEKEVEANIARGMRGQDIAPTSNRKSSVVPDTPELQALREKLAEAKGQLKIKQAILARFMANQEQHGFISNAATAMKGWMLSGVENAFRDLLGTAAFQPAEMLSHIPGSIMDIIQSTFSRDANARGRRTLMSPSTSQVLHAAGKGIVQGAIDFPTIMKTGRTPEGEALQELMDVPRELNVNTRYRTWNTLVNLSANLPSRWRSAIDMFSFRAAYDFALRDRAKAMATNEASMGRIPRSEIPTRAKDLISQANEAPSIDAIQDVWVKQLMEASHRDAEMRTFHNENVFSSIVARGRAPIGGKYLSKVMTDKQLRQVDAVKNLLIDIPLPFARSMTNYLKMGLWDYQPWGLTYNALRGISTLFRKELPEKLQRDISLKFGRGMTGSALFLMGYALGNYFIGPAKNGEDYNSKAARFGGEPMSFYNPATKAWDTVQILGPAGLPLVMGAMSAQEDQYDNAVDALIGNAVHPSPSRVFQVGSQAPVIRGANTISGLASGQMTPAEFVGQFARRLIPLSGAMSDFAKVVDDRNRRTRLRNKSGAERRNPLTTYLEEFLQMAGSGIPFYRNTMEEKHPAPPYSKLTGIFPLQTVPAKGFPTLKPPPQN